MSKKTVIRVGDKVKVIRCNFVRRVGYPLVWYEIKSEVANDERTLAAWETLTGAKNPLGLGELQTSAKRPLTAFDDFVKTVAMMRVSERGFGGKERSLHYRKVDSNLSTVDGLFWAGQNVDEPVPDVTGMIFKVWDKRLVHTGTRRAGWADAEDSYPAGLDDRRTRVLLSLDPGEIEDVDVELVSRGGCYL